MTRVVIPTWNASGVLPPVSASAPTGPERSPYPVSLSEFMLRFATSAKRQQILNGFLQYRALLHSAGLNSGFQWLDGSFLENIEITEARDPNDLDVVTFFSLPAGVTQQQVLAAQPSLTDRNHLKATYHVDAFLVSLGQRGPELVERSVYWYSIWSHRRDATWKGFLQIDLDPADDQLAALPPSVSVSPGGSP